MFRSRSSRSGSSSKLTKPSSPSRSEEHTSELQSQSNLVCRLLLEKKKKILHAGAHLGSPQTDAILTITSSLERCFRLPNVSGMLDVLVNPVAAYDCAGVVSVYASAPRDI